MEPLSEETVDKTLSLIRDEPCLPHPLGKLLSSFITQAVDPPLAAAHVLSYCHSGQHREAELRALVSDWTFIIESITNTGLHHLLLTAGPKLKFSKEMATDAASRVSQRV
ncbi:hypothetical protein NW756_003730 [Fusarium oxysporum]|nr:hypothetical protein NW753_007726 [Fusarium oxysporum]KAJ4062253.1 hypothetical protein NW763_005669 [Fusarium oxysporum]KAJ4099113.1 hypothetical protein NW756_003730 [Fusarium oxysporum]KAJ4114209.1 hypothetical protein NW769_004992 [Fusarium oxysporum]KAJ4240824.1 hypothetical protein NW760_001105 [Fusarium oxysporum]